MVHTWASISADCIFFPRAVLALSLPRAASPFPPPLVSPPASPPPAPPPAPTASATVAAPAPAWVFAALRGDGGDPTSGVPAPPSTEPTAAAAPLAMCARADAPPASASAATGSDHEGAASVRAGVSASWPGRKESFASSTGFSSFARYAWTGRRGRRGCGAIAEACAYTHKVR